MLTLEAYDKILLKLKHAQMSKHEADNLCLSFKTPSPPRCECMSTPVPAASFSSVQKIRVAHLISNLVEVGFFGWQPWNRLFALGEICVLSYVWHPQEDAVIGLEKAGLPMQLNA